MCVVFHAEANYRGYFCADYTFADALCILENIVCNYVWVEVERERQREKESYT